MADYGKNTIGGSNEALAADTKRFTKFTAPSDIGDVDSISAYLNRTGTGSGYAIRGGIYTDSAGAPNALVANSAIEISANIARNAPAWYSVSYVTKPTLTPGAVYWLGVQAAKASVTYFDTGATNQEASLGDVYTDGLADPFGSPSYHAHEQSVYVSYTPPVADRRGQVSWAELEVPVEPRRGQVSWAELETPDAPRRGQLSWAELEVPDLSADRRAQVSWSELEVPSEPRRAQLSWAELETPSEPRRAQLSFAELETPNEPRRAQASWAELEVPSAPPTYTSYGMPFKYDAAEWSSPTFALEVYMRATTGTVYARLYNLTDTVAVASSEVSTVSASFVRLRSGALTLTTLKDYVVQFGKLGADAGEFYGGKLVAT